MKVRADSYEARRERLIDQATDGGMSKEELKRASADLDAKAAKRRARKHIGNRPSIASIVSAQPFVLAILPHVERGLEDRSCWACGTCWPDGDHALERAHIVGVAYGGDNDPTNFVLLCCVCHGDQPDGADLVTQLAWMASRPSFAELMSRMYGDVIAAMRAVAVARGDASVVNEFLHATPNAKYGLMRSGAAKSCGFRNGVANMRWSLFRAFVAWLDERGGGAG